MPAAKKETKKKTAKAPAATASKSSTKKFQDFTIKTKRSGRYLVLGKDGKVVNGADKTKVLIDAKLVQVSLPQAKKEEAPTT